MDNRNFTMTIIHGSTNIIKQPVYGAGNVANDYGRGFYCTENMELAKEWACSKNVDGFANFYELDTSGLSVLNLKEYSILNWLAVLTRYRGYWQKNSIAEEAKDYLQQHFYVDVDDYDVIIGNRADDSYFSFAQDFIMGAISVNQLERAMKLGKLGEQIVLKSKKAFSQINFTGYEVAYAEEFFLKKNVRDIEARKQYRLDKPGSSHIDELFIVDIMRKGMTSYESGI